MCKVFRQRHFRIETAPGTNLGKAIDRFSYVSMEVLERLCTCPEAGSSAIARMNNPVQMNLFMLHPHLSGRFPGRSHPADLNASTRARPHGPRTIRDLPTTRPNRHPVTGTVGGCSPNPQSRESGQPQRNPGPRGQGTLGDASPNHPGLRTAGKRLTKKGRPPEGNRPCSTNSAAYGTRRGNDARKDRLLAALPAVIAVTAVTTTGIVTGSFLSLGFLPGIVGSASRLFVVRPLGRSSFGHSTPPGIYRAQPSDGRPCLESRAGTQDPL